VKKIVAGLAVQNAVLGAALLLVTRINPDDLIIAAGVRGASLITWACYAVIAALFVLLNARSLKKLFKHLRDSRYDNSPLRLSVSRPGDISPEDVRKDLRYLAERQPVVEGYMMRGGYQLDSIDRKQLRLRQILSRNKDESLDAVVDTMEKAEQTILSRLRKVIDLSILVDPHDKTGTAASSRSRSMIERHLQLNDEILAQCDTLMTETVMYLGSRDSANVDSSADIAAMTEAMQALRQMNAATDDLQMNDQRYLPEAGPTLDVSGLYGDSRTKTGVRRN